MTYLQPYKLEEVNKVSVSYVQRLRGSELTQRVLSCS